MADPRLTPLGEMRNLMDPEFVKTNKINCIRLIRQLSGESLREAKEFFEQEWYQFVVEGQRKTSVYAKPVKDFDEILRRLSALENEVYRLTKVEIKQVAKNLFNED